MAVVATFEFDDLVATGESAHQSQHRHAGFGAAVHEANHLHTGNGVDHHLRQRVFECAGGSEAGALLNCFLQRTDHFGMGMTTDRGPPAADVVDVFVVINVPGVGALDAIENDRLATHRFECTHWGAHATRHQSLGGTEQLLGATGVEAWCCHGGGCQGADANRATS